MYRIAEQTAVRVLAGIPTVQSTGLNTDTALHQICRDVACNVSTPDCVPNW
jgi:hypothetical protein